MSEEATNKPLVEVVKQSDYFFKDLLERAVRNQHVEISEEATVHILSILVRALKYEPNDEEKRIADKTMAERNGDVLTEILSDGNPVNQLITIGNVSLMISGIWWRSLYRKLVDVDYYIAIGRLSYQRVSKSVSANHAEIFEELSEHFVEATNVLTEATECLSLPETNPSNFGILRAYEVYLRTGNPFLARKLRELGISVVPGKTTVQ